MKMYPRLRLIWLMFLVNALTSLASLAGSDAVSIASAFIGLAANGVIVYALSRVSSESALLNRAFFYWLTALVLSLLSTGSTLLVRNPESALGVFSVLLMPLELLFSLLAQYQLFWALDERIIPLGYAYPARRIRWCFYAPLVATLTASILLVPVMARISSQAQAQTPEQLEALLVNQPALTWITAVMQLLGQIAVLTLFFRYNRAVKNREGDPLAL